MKISRVLPLASLLAVPLVSRAVVIDNFGDADLSEYTLTRILDNGAAESNVSFSQSSGNIVASYTGTVSQAEQVLFLRSDVSLGVGYTLQVDVSFATQASQMDFGIAVANVAPTSIVNGVDTDTRDTLKWAAVYVRPSQDTVRNTTFDTALVSATGILPTAETLVKSLYIRRSGASTFDLGYINTSDVDVPVRSISFASSASVGTLLGFYADLRTVGGTLSSLDNLSVVPEPSSFAALAGGLVLGAAALRRRRHVSRA